MLKSLILKLEKRNRQLKKAENNHSDLKYDYRIGYEKVKKKYKLSSVSAEFLENLSNSKTYRKKSEI